MVEWGKIIIISIFIIIFSFCAWWSIDETKNGNMEKMIKQEECEKYDMTYLKIKVGPQGEFCVKDDAIYPIQTDCNKVEGIYGCDMYFIGGWNK